jgi:hypothetical protein
MPARLRLLPLFVVAATVPSARALIVFGYDAGVHERFTGGTIGGTPSANSGFFLNGYDFSGVGWQTGNTNFAVTLVSPQHFLAARHAAPANGSSVSFLGSDGIVRTYTVETTTALPYSPGVDSDLVVGKLTQTVAAPVTFYASLSLGSNLNSYTGVELAVYGAQGRTGRNTIAGFASADFLPQDSVPDSLFAITNYDAVNGGTLTAPAATQGQAGDSSGPSFVRIGSSLAIVGVHSAINLAGTQTYDTFVPNHLTDINAVLLAGGYSLQLFTAIPEPGTFALAAGLAAGLAALERRRRSRARAAGRR